MVLPIALSPGPPAAQTPVFVSVSYLVCYLLHSWSVPTLVSKVVLCPPPYWRAPGLDRRDPRGVLPTGELQGWTGETWEASSLLESSRAGQERPERRPPYWRAPGLDRRDLRGVPPTGELQGWTGETWEASSLLESTRAGQERPERRPPYWRAPGLDRRDLRGVPPYWRAPGLDRRDLRGVIPTGELQGWTGETREASPLLESSRAGQERPERPGVLCVVLCSTYHLRGRSFGHILCHTSSILVEVYHSWLWPFSLKGTKAKCRLPATLAL